MTMILISPGVSSSNTTPRPLSAFYIDETEVGSENFEAFCRNTKFVPKSQRNDEFAVIDESTDAWRFVSRDEYRAWLSGVYRGVDSGRLPACQLTVEDAQAYVRWAGCDLPLEEEYAYLLNEAAGVSYPWGASWPPPRGRVNCRDSSFARRFPASTSALSAGEYDDGFPARSPLRATLADSWGLFDVSGNVEEWCRVTEVRSGMARVRKASPPYEVITRGGSWATDARQSLMSNSRGEVTSVQYSESIGFRCAREVHTIKRAEIGGAEDLEK